MASIYRCGINPELLTYKNPALLCIHCGGVPLHPYQCQSCYKLIGKECAEFIERINSHIPYKCPSCKSAKKAVQYIVANKLVSEQEMIHFTCNQKIKVDSYINHIKSCHSNAKYRCSNEKCAREIQDEPLIIAQTSLIACSLPCLYKIQIQEAVKSKITNYEPLLSELYGVIDKAISTYANPLEIPIMLPSYNPTPALTSGVGVCNFVWDPKMCSEIVVSNDGKKITLNEPLYLFRSILSEKPFEKKAIYYWELVAEADTENELKIGVCTKKNFKFNTAFCDYEYGFAYYGLAQLRHGSNSAGGKYGKPFKNSGTLGVCLNMIEVCILRRALWNST